MMSGSDKKPREKSTEINAYCAFRDDRDRRLALISRDVRLVIMAGIAALVVQSGPLPGARALLSLLGMPV